MNRFLVRSIIDFHIDAEDGQTAQSVAASTISVNAAMASRIVNMETEAQPFNPSGIVVPRLEIKKS